MLPPNRTSCLLPWLSMETSPTGGARPCCLYREEIKDENGEKYSLTKVPLSTIFKSSYMQNLRKEFREGKKPAGCQTCWDEEAAGRQSKRISTFYRLKHLQYMVDWHNDTPTTLKFLDLKLGNICNLKCRICGSWSSSKWAKEEIAYSPNVNKKELLAYKNFMAGQWPRKSVSFWDDLKELLPEIAYFEFTGGEPFLIKEHFKLLEFAVEQGYAKNIEIHYNTNGTIYPDEIIHLWKEFKQVEVAFSVDNVGKRFEYERYGANWEEVERNIKRMHFLRVSMPNLRTQVCLTVNAFNVLYLEELCNWISEQNFNDDYFNLCPGPEYFRIDRLPENVTKLVLHTLELGKFSAPHQKQISFLINFIKNGKPSDGREFLINVKKTDLHRNEKLSDSHPELAEAFGYNNDTFCPLPWIHLATHPTGYITLCCEADHTGLKSASYDITDPTIFDGQPKFYNLKTDRLYSAMNSQSVRNARLNMLAGVKHDPCSTCYKKEEQGLLSKRLREKANYPEFTFKSALETTNTLGYANVDLEFVELRLGNVCNSRCVTCNPLSSSQWRQDYLKLSEKFDFIEQKFQKMDKGRFVTWPSGFKDSNIFELDWYENRGFWIELIDHSPNLQTIYINGGEPTLIKQHWLYLNHLIETNRSQNITLWYSINLTNIPESAYAVWDKFKTVQLSCSIDDLDKRNTYIRYPGDWNTILSNYRELLTHKYQVSITQTISAYNVYYLDEFYDFFNTHNIHYNFVNDPAYLSVDVLPIDARQRILFKIKDKLPYHFYNQIYKKLNSSPWDKDSFNKFIAVTEELDTIRRTNWKEIFPELHWLLHYYI